MFGFLKSKRGDDELSREFVRHVFAVGRESCPSIAEAIQMTTQGNVPFPVNDDACLEISLAILGTSLAVLKGHSQVMTVDRGTHIETLCKRSIRMDYDLYSDSAEKLNEALDEYEAVFEKSMVGKNNPFGAISGMMLVRCLGPRAKALCIAGTSALNPFVHQVVGDLMTMTVTQVLMFWNGK